jgi:hypothetical protein
VAHALCVPRPALGDDCSPIFIHSYGKSEALAIGRHAISETRMPEFLNSLRPIPPIPSPPVSYSSTERPNDDFHQKLIADLANAQNSTGPKSDANKRKVSLNSLTHGFAGQTCFVPEHEREAYIAHFQSFGAEWKPKGPTEQYMVQSLAELSWSVQQIRAVVNNIMSLSGTKSSPRDTGAEGTDFTLAQAANVSEHLKELNLLGIYEQRKHRLFNSTPASSSRCKSTAKRRKKKS